MVSVKKKTLFNGIMVAAVVAIVAGAVLAVGSLQGWFGASVTEQRVVGDEGGPVAIVRAGDKVGNVNIERGGLAYVLENGTEMRDGDIVQTLAGSTISLAAPDVQATFDGNTEAIVRLGASDVDLVQDAAADLAGGSSSVSAEAAGSGSASALSLDLTTGALFVNASDSTTVKLGDAGVEAKTDDAVFSVDAPHGSANVRVYAGAVEVGGTAVEAGQAAALLADGSQPDLSALALGSLSAFELAQVKEAAAAVELCFTQADIEALEAERAAQTAQATVSAGAAGSLGQAPAGSSPSSPGGSASGNAGASGASTSGSANAPDASGGDAAPEYDSFCTIVIRCDDLLGNLDKLAPGKDRFVPSNGVILATSTVGFNEGEAVFDVLQRACSLAGIQLEYSWTPAYDSHYIEGINNLYEFDCGPESGWTYQVNGWRPNYGASAYKLQDGDAIVWSYAVSGAGQF